MMQEGAIVTTFQNMGELPLGTLRKKCDTAHFFVVQSELPNDRIKSLTAKLKKLVLAIVDQAIFEGSLGVFLAASTFTHVLTGPVYFRKLIASKF